MTKYKAGKISGMHLFALLFICNVLVLFTKSTLSINGQLSADVFLSLLLSMGITALVGIPANIAAKRGQCLLSNKYTSALYALYFIYLGAISIGRFSLFASTELDYETRAWAFALLLIAACIYGAYLGLEAISRFSSVAFFLIVAGIAVMILFSVREFSVFNLFPFSKNETAGILANAFDFASDTAEIVLTVALAPKVNGGVKKPFYFSIVLSFLFTALLLLCAVGVMGDAAALTAYPFFELAQLARMTESVRLDSLYTAFWILAVFIKSTILLYCAAECLPFKKKSLRCLTAAGAMLLFTLTITSTNSFFITTLYSRLVPFLVFAFALPTILLFTAKKTKGDELLETF